MDIPMFTLSIGIFMGAVIVALCVLIIFSLRK